MNLLNLGAGALSWAQGPPAGSPVVAQTSAAQVGASVTAAVPGRDRLISALPDDASLVNALQQFAGSPTSTPAASDASQEAELTLPPLAPMPAPQAAPAVPTDDHGQSNIVFSDSGSDSDSAGSLIH